MSNEPNETTTPAPAPAQQTPAQFGSLSSALAQAEAQATTQLQEQCTRLLDLKLSASGLPAPMCEIVRAHFQDANGQVKLFQPAELDGEIERTKTAHAQMSAQNAIRDMGVPVQNAQRKPVVTGMWDSLERITAAYERLMGLPIKAEFSEVPRLTGIRELYFHLTGDRELRGMFKPERVQFAVSGATTPIVASTMNDITADVLNKLAMQSWNAWSAKGYNWYTRCTEKRDAANLQDVKWVTPAGFANLAAVNEGAVYPELTWSDVRENATFVKKGGYLPLTIEMIDKDDTQSWRSVGKHLGTAAIRTLSAYIAAIFTTNAVLNQDGVALFSVATHGNLIGYDLDQTGWDAAGQAIFDQGEVGSGKALGLTPDRVLIPREKRKMALKLFFTDREPGGSLNDVNVAALDKTKDSEGPVIVVPDWTDADDWVAMVDPALYPGIGVAYRFGDTPEIFSAADASSFLLFYQDCLPIKVRFFFAAAAIDYRPMVKSSI